MNTLTDFSKSWIPGEWVGATVRIIAGTGAGQVRGVLDNDATTLTVDAAWETDPVGSFAYSISLSYLAGVVRGQGGTTPMAHPAGSLILQPVPGEGYIQIVAAHPCQAVRQVYVDGVIQAGGYIVNLDDTTLIPGRHLTTVTIPILPGSPGSGANGGAGSAAAANPTGTVTVQGQVTPRRCSASMPSWLRSATQWRASIALSITFDTSVSPLAPSLLHATIQNFINIFLSGSGGSSITAAAVHTDENGHLVVTTAATQISLGGAGGGTVVFSLDNVGGHYSDDGLVSLLQSLSDIAVTAVGSCEFTGLTVDYDYLPEQVNSEAFPQTVPPGTLGVPTPQAASILDKLKKIQVTCDADGIMDDDTGTITGVPNQLIEIPGDIDKHLLTVYCGAPSAIFGTSYVYARSRHVELGYKQDLVINTKTTLAEIFAQSAQQSRCWVFSDGVYVNRVFLDANPSVDSNVELLRFLSGPPEFGETLRSFIKTQRTLKYSYRWAPGTFLQIEKIALTGDIYDENLQAIDEFKLVPQLGTMARDLLSYTLGFFRRQRRTLKGKLVWTETPLDVGDVISLSFNASELNSDRGWDDGAGPGWDVGVRWDQAASDVVHLYSAWGGIRFRIHRSNLNLLTNTLDIEAIEV